MKYIIYGAGGNCKFVMEHMEEGLLCIADKDEKKWGKKGSTFSDELGGVDIISPRQINDYDYDMIVVSVRGNYAGIRDELLSQGIEANKIMHWSQCISVSKRNTGTMKIEWDKKLPINGIYSALCRYAADDNEMERYFLVGEHERCFKWLHYFEAYNRHFGDLIGKDINILEIGVQKGGSIQIWKNVFGKKAHIYGVDIQSVCEKFEDDQVRIFIGDQEDRAFWGKVKQEIPKLDIVIDDGGHYMQQQIVTFEEMFPHVKNGGVYICEDIGTSYNINKYHAGYKEPDTFVEYSKSFIDYIHAWYAEGEKLQINEYTKTMHSLHYYYGLLAIEKREMAPPMDMEIENVEGKKKVVCHMRGNFS